MPVIQQFDPLSAASDAVGAYSDRKRQNDLDAQAQAYQKQRDARRDMESDRSYGLQKGEADDEHAQTLSQLQTADQQRQIAAATEEYNEKLRPIMLDQQQLQNQMTRGEIKAQDAQAQLVKLQTKAASVDLEIKKKYGLPAAAAALKQSQAEASTAQTEAKIAPQQALANLAATQASTEATRAGTALTQKETALAGTSAGRGGRGSSATERAQSAYDDAMNSLSDTGRKFYDMLYSTNNPPTRAQAMLALQATMRNGSGLTPDDRKKLETLINSRESQFVSPSEQAGQERYEQRTATANDRNTTRDREAEFREVVKGKSFNALPPRLKDMVRHVMVDQGLSVQDALQQLPQAPIDDASKQAITRALSGG